MDDLGQIGFESITIFKYIPPKYQPESGIPGYSFFILLGISAVTVIILAKNRN